MARFPVIESPCPAGKRVPSGASEHCSTCDRAVFNLDVMNDTERRTFMRGCSGKVCVAYTVRVPVKRNALAVAALAAAALVALPVAADDVAKAGAPGPAADAPAQAPPASDAGALPKDDEFGDMVLVGSVLDAGDAEWVDEADAAPELPVVADDGR